MLVGMNDAIYSSEVLVYFRLSSPSHPPLAEDSQSNAGLLPGVFISVSFTIHHQYFIYCSLYSCTLQKIPACFVDHEFFQELGKLSLGFTYIKLFK